MNGIILKYSKSNLQEENNMGDLADCIKLIKQEQIIVKTGIITLNTDRLKLEMYQFKENIIKGDFITPFSIMLTALTTLITATFNNVILPAHIWNYIYICIFAFFGSIAVKNAVFNLIHSKERNINNILEKLMQ